MKAPPKCSAYYYAVYKTNKLVFQAYHRQKNFCFTLKRRITFLFQGCYTSRRYTKFSTFLSKEKEILFDIIFRLAGIFAEK